MPNISNLDIAVSSFCQLTRHWNQGQKAKLELSYEDRSLHMQLSALLGHPDQPHFPDPSPHHPPPPPSSPPFPSHRKNKSPSQLRCQERRQQEVRAAEAAAPTVIIEETEKDLPDEVPEAEINDITVKNVENHAEDACTTFKCDQCVYTNLTEKGLKQHTCMKHRISQVDGTHYEEELENINCVAIN